MILPSTIHNGILIVILTLTIAAMLVICEILWFKRAVVRQGRGKMIVGLGTFLIIGGLAVIVSQLDFHVATQVKMPNTLVQGCFEGNVYQVWAVNSGNDKDTIFITLVLPRGQQITDIQPKIGVSQPDIIQGGKGWEFVKFKITDLLPQENNLPSPLYYVYVSTVASQPMEFSAWSEKISSNVTAQFHGQCPSITSWGPEETRLVGK